MPPPRIAVTMGDPAGVGPEICLRLLREESITARCTPVIFGDAGVLRRVAERTGLPAPAAIFRSLSESDRPGVLEITALARDAFEPATVSAVAGRAGYEYIDAAIAAAMDAEVSAITTAPINKEALHSAGIDFPGHTEILARKTSSDFACMMQYSDEITCTFVTTHVGYREVPALLSEDLIFVVIVETAHALKRIRGREPKILVCGLNPHAGEHGLFGDQEEEKIILPAIDSARRAGIDVEGPLPPDTAFTPARRASSDAVVCMYHDQGHIPVKALAFDKAVNVTLGLPIIRTSVDHGTAFDIAWQGKASPSSLFEAVKLAVKLAS